MYDLFNILKGACAFYSWYNVANGGFIFMYTVFGY